jgi:hypothetical protein
MPSLEVCDVPVGSRRIDNSFAETDSRVPAAELGLFSGAGQMGGPLKRQQEHSIAA